MKTNDNFISICDEIFMKILITNIKKHIKEVKVLNNLEYIYSRLINIFSSFYITDEVVNDIRIRNSSIDNYFKNDFVYNNNHKISLQKEVLKELKNLRIDAKIKESFIDLDILKYLEENSTNLSIIDKTMIDYYLEGIFNSDKRFSEFVIIKLNNNKSDLKLNVSKLLLELLLVKSESINDNFIISLGINSLKILPIEKIGDIIYNERIDALLNLIDVYNVRLKSAGINFKEAISNEKKRIVLVSVGNKEFILTPEFIIDKVNKKYICKNISGIRDIISFEKELLLKKEEFDLDELHFKLLVNILVDSFK